MMMSSVQHAWWEQRTELANCQNSGIPKNIIAKMLNFGHPQNLHTVP